MKSIGICDRNGKEIVEGDTLQLFMKDTQKNEYYDFLKVDKFICYVTENTLNIGAIIEEQFFSNGKRVGTYQQEMDFLISENYEMSDGEVITKDRYIKEILEDGSSLDDIQILRRNSLYGCTNFYHAFYHVEKEIIKESVTGVERELILSSTSDLLINLVDGTTINPDKELLIELSKEMIEWVKDSSLIIYEDDSSVEGVFTHLKAVTNRKTNYEHSYDFYGCNEKGEVTYFEYNENLVKQRAKFSELRKQYDIDNQKLLDDGMNEKEARSIAFPKFQASKKEIENSRDYKTKSELNIMITLNASADVLSHLVKNGSVIVN